MREVRKPAWLIGACLVSLALFVFATVKLAG